VRSQLASLSRPNKKLVLMGSDFTMLWLVLCFAYYARLGHIEEMGVFSHNLAIFMLLPGLSVLACWYFGLYRAVTRFTGIEIQGTIARSIIAGLAIFILILFLVPQLPSVPRSIPAMYLPFGIFALIISRYLAGSWIHGCSFNFLASRLLGRSASGIKKGEPILIYGAGTAGRQVNAAISKNYKYNPVAYIDDDTRKYGTRIASLEVFLPLSIPKLIEKHQVNKILLAIPSVNAQRKKEIIAFLEPYQLHIISMPGLDEVADGKVSLKEIREVSIEEILGRTPVAAIPALLAPHIKDKNVLVTGAGGSIGSELCRQIIKQQPTSLVIFENSEVNLYKIHSELETISASISSSTIIYPVLGSVARSATIGPVMQKFGIHTVYHAAAYKHVPMVEYNTDAAFANNILGTIYTAEAAIIAGVEKFVLVSTDKAVRPTNFMGATKRMAELALQALSHEKAIQPLESYQANQRTQAHVINRTQFTMVRFGNVLDSSGSVVPKFRQQIEDGGPITVTHPDIIRYFMTIPEAAQLVIQAGSMGTNGDVFVLDMGEPVRIADLAQRMISLYGLELRNEKNPNGDIEICYTGLRPGEKLYEELLISDNPGTTQHEQIFKANETMLSWEQLKALLAQIRSAFQQQDYQQVRDTLEGIEQLGYQPSDEISDWYYEAEQTNETIEEKARA